MTPEEKHARTYADQRHTETGQPYIVTDMNRVVLDHILNRVLISELDELIVYHSAMRRPDAADIYAKVAKEFRDRQLSLAAE